MLSFHPTRRNTTINHALVTRAYPRYVRIMNIIQEKLNFKFIEKLHDRDQYINICIIYLCNCIYLISLFPKILRYFLKIIAFFKLHEKVSRSDD